MTSPKVKICGLTREDLVLAAADADAVGFVVASPDSHRDLPLEQVAALARAASPLQTTVAVTASRDPATLLRIAREAGTDAMQVTFRAGQAVFDEIRQVHPRLLLLVSCRPEDAHLVPESFPHALVLDAAAIDGYGGAGKLTDWGRARAVRDASTVPVVLAGGLTPENVAEAAAAVRPYAVDVSSGVETDKVKDPEKIRRFVAAARSVVW